MQRAILCAAIALAFAPAAHGDVITDWCEKATGMAYPPALAGGTPATNGARTGTMAHVAMYEAVNSIEKRYTPYRELVPASPGASKEAAASAAARSVLLKFVTAPDKVKEIEAHYQAALAAIPDGAAKTEGIAVGERAAAVILADRANDGVDAPNDYRPHTSPGTYVPTQMPAAINWFKVTPYSMQRANQFRAPPPYALSSPAWARDYAEVKRLGAKVGSARTEEQTRIAKFWEFVGPGTYMPLAVQVVKQKNLDVTDSARALALVSMAGFDAGVAVFDSKYAYNFWRPVTAIRNGDRDDNPDTERDERWEPFINTPMHPEYPCAHCTFQSAAATTLRALYGDGIAEVKLVSTTAPGVERRFTKLSDYVAEVINARIYDGVHYRTSGEVGAEIGRQIGEYTVATYFKPLR